MSLAGFLDISSVLSQALLPSTVHAFEPAGSCTPIGHYKTLAEYKEDHDFRPEWRAGCVFHDCDGGRRRWVFFPDPTAYLTCSLADTICLLEKAIVGNDIDYNEINRSYPHTWGCNANYIEFVPRFFGGLHGMIRILPAIPPSQNGVPTCLLLRGLFAPPLGCESCYAIDFGRGFDEGLFVRDGETGKYFEKGDDLARAFNAFAHARGLKTGFCMVINSGQLFVNEENFSWRHGPHLEAFVNACVNGIALGFDAIHFDSIKHAGGYDENGLYQVYDHENYHGAGDPVPYATAQWITNEIRARTGRMDLSFVGEYAGTDPRYRLMGLSAGIEFDALTSDVTNIAACQAGSPGYKTGLFVSNDNNGGRRSFDETLTAAWRGLCDQGQYPKVPVLFSQADLFPAIPCYHHLIERAIHWRDDGGRFHPDAASYRFELNWLWACAAAKW